MKYLFQVFFPIFSLLSGSNAIAGQWHLSCNNMAGDGGYAVVFSADGLTAEVSENNIAGAKVVATLGCPNSKPAPCCDRVTNTVCVDQDRNATANDTGYSATLATGGLAGLSTVVLRHGRAKVAKIPCRSEQ
jgi:hypothetical protein